MMSQCGNHANNDLVQGQVQSRMKFGLFEFESRALHGPDWFESINIIVTTSAGCWRPGRRRDAYNVCALWALFFKKKKEVARVRY